MQKVKVLIVDDSQVTRSILLRELSKDPELEIVGTAEDAYSARDKILELNPDVITLDIGMPRMDGLTFLEKLMHSRPIPVVILSALDMEMAEVALKAIELGAIEVMSKSGFNAPGKFKEMVTILADKIKAAALAKAAALGSSGTIFNQGELAHAKTKIVVIGASTGGTEAVRFILKRLPNDFPPIVIVQHMPEYITQNFAESMDRESKIQVREAKDGDVLKPGLALVARGNFHLTLKGNSGAYFVQVKDGELVCRQRPSVDVLFDSVAECAGADAVGVILTGMGKDGAKGLLHMKEKGAYTIAQDEASCVVYGMPKEAVELKAVKKVLPLDKIPEALMVYFQKQI